MWKNFIASAVNSTLRIELFRIGVLIFISILFGFLQYFHILPDTFFTSRIYGLIQVVLFLSLCVICYILISKHNSKKNLEKLKKDMEEIIGGEPTDKQTH